MKYRLVELLRCVGCYGDLDVTHAETRLLTNSSKVAFVCQRYCSLNRMEAIPDPEQCVECGTVEIMTGTLSCHQCGRDFPILGSVPWLFEQPSGAAGKLLSESVDLYSHLWTTLEGGASHEHAQQDRLAHTHVDAMEEALGECVVQGKIGVDAGSGSGKDTETLARRFPSVEVISLDISEGVYETRRHTEELRNVHIVRASVLESPIRSGTCDFGYSFGVLHHTTDPIRGLQEIVRSLKPGGRVSLYLYEDHADNPWKAIPLRLVNALRLLTTKLNPKLLSGLCYLLSPFIVAAFSIPARLMGSFKLTMALAKKMPFNFGTSLFSVHGDLVDRLGAPIEVRYNRDRLQGLLRAGHLANIRVTKLKSIAGWAIRGIKPGT